MEKTVDGMTWPNFISFPERLGMEKGEIKGRLEGLETALDIKFQQAGLALMPELRKIEDPQRLATILQVVRKATSLDEVRAALAQNPPAAS